MLMPDALRHVIKHPSMFFWPIEFDVAVAFLQGFDVANNGGLLVAFREWLIPMVGHGDNLVWSSLVLHLAYPGNKDPRMYLSNAEEEKRSTEFLFRMLEEFYEERGTGQGLRRIYLRYQEWLQHQSCYQPSSFEYIVNINEKNNSK